MAPSQNNEGVKKPEMIVKRLWNTLKTSKGKKEDLVFDATGDQVCEEKPAEDSSHQPVQPEQTKNTCNEQTTSNIETAEENSKDEDISEEKEEAKRQERRKTRGTKQKKSRDSPTQIIYNVQADQGAAVNIQLYTSNQTYYMQQTYNGGVPVPTKETKSKTNLKLTPKIEAVLKSTVKLGSGHIENLSKHFGKSCRDIGLVLALSSGEIDQIENDCGKDMKEMSFEIMSSWMRKKGDKATIGRLCVRLWNSKIPRAREAVKHLSDDIDEFN